MNYMPTAMVPAQAATYRHDYNVAVASTGRYRPTTADYVSRFFAALQKWKSETYYESSPTKLQEHQSFKDMVAIGEPAIPLILGELASKPSLLILALARIVGTVPYTNSEKGNLAAMTDAWLSWGQKRGYDC